MSRPTQPRTECGMNRTLKHYRWGNVGCGYCMSQDRTWVTHVFAWIFAAMTFVFSYAALLESGSWMVAFGGFVMGMALLFFLYGQSVDEFYIHIGEKFKIGAAAYNEEDDDPVQVAFEDDP